MIKILEKLQLMQEMSLQEFGAYTAGKLIPQHQVFNPIIKSKDFIRAI